MAKVEIRFRGAARTHFVASGIAFRDPSRMRLLWLHAEGPDAAIEPWNRHRDKARRFLVIDHNMAGLSPDSGHAEFQAASSVRRLGGGSGRVSRSGPLIP